MTDRYASQTTVDVDRSRADVERTLMRYGADEFAYSMRRSEVTVGFVLKGLTVRMVVPMPDRADREFTHHSRGVRTFSAAEAAYDQAVRQRWRAILLVVKAKLEAVAAGISTMEREFLADVVTENGMTVHERIQPMIETSRRLAGQITAGG